MRRGLATSADGGHIQVSALVVDWAICAEVLTKKARAATFGCAHVFGLRVCRCGCAAYHSL